MKAELNAIDLAKQLTVKVHIKGINTWAWRLQIAKGLIALALYISGMGFEFIDSERMST